MATAWRRVLSRPRVLVTAAATATAAAAAASTTTATNAKPRPRNPLRLPLAHAEYPTHPNQRPSPTTPTSSATPKPVPPSSPGAPRPPPASAPPLSRYAVADAVERVLPAVVNIRRIAAAPNPEPVHSLFGPLFPADAAPAVEVSCGSGFFISSDGLIVTNAHVVQSPRSGIDILHLDPQQAPRRRPSSGGRSSGGRDGDDDDNNNNASLQVTLSSGETYVARVVAVDDASDIALVRIHAEHALPVAELGNSATVRPGEFVAAVGSPLALANSVSFGIVSTLARDLSPPAPGLNHLQLDVAINQGSSGGPVVALDGRVVGICSMKVAGDAEGIAFAIPIDYARRAVADLREHGFVRRPFVGLTLVSVTPDLFDDIRRDAGYRPPPWLEAEIRQTNSAKSIGLIVHDLAQGAPAQAAGLEPGDVIVAVNGVPTTTTSEFLAVLAAHVETECVLRVRRAASGESTNVNIRPEVLPADRLRP